MFYSHEILSNRQYGVATIWLVATVGKENQRRLTKRAIQEVNVPKACEKILDPGAPLALRLQGNLLYGVSRVFSQQCGYVLTEAEKTQSDMMTFFRIMKTSEIDPQAGKTKRQNNILQDDPAFDLLSALPNINQLEWDKDLALPRSQGSTLLFSQLTPLGSNRQASSLSGFNPALLNLELTSSSHSAASCRIPSDFGHQSPLFDKSGVSHLSDMPPFQPFMDDGFDPVSGMGLEFDGDGNLIEVTHQEPELPILPDMDDQMAQARIPKLDNPEPEGLLLGEDAYRLELGEPALPDAAAFPTGQATGGPIPSHTEATEGTQAQQASARLTRTRRNKTQSMLDTEICFSRRHLRDWGANYVENMIASRKRSTVTTVAQARKNAIAFLYGNGVANIGAFRAASGSLHPLAADFAGLPLQCRLNGQKPEAVEAEIPARKRGRPRKFHEAFDAQDDINQDRSTSRQRIDEEAELGRGDTHMTEEFMRLDDDYFIPEVGMDAAPPLEDRHSSSAMPWSRPGSVVPGSSVRGSAQKQRAAPSPLFGRGSSLDLIGRFSDQAEPPLDLGDFGSHDSSLIYDGSAGPLALHAGDDTQVAGLLDAASQEFLNFAKEGAIKRGRTFHFDNQHRRWVKFEDLVHPDDHTRGVAAQAFLHVLTLATKNAISVQQDGADKMKPFGAINIGFDVSDVAEQAESEDELA